MPPRNHAELAGLGFEIDTTQHACQRSVSSTSSGSASYSPAPSPLLGSGSPWQSACPSPVLPSSPLLSPIPQSPVLIPPASPGSLVLSKLKRRKRAEPIPMPCSTPTLSKYRSTSNLRRANKSKAPNRPSVRMLLLLLMGCLTLLMVVSSLSWLTTSRNQQRQASYASRASVPSSRTRDAARDALILYRIIGNDLPPRHASNQTLSNLRFLLQNENDFASIQTPTLHRVEKYFVFNRIVSETLRSRVRALLAEFHVSDERVLEIPFEWEEYENRQIRWDSAVADATGLWGIGRPPGLLQGVEELQATQLANQTFAAIEATERLPAQKAKREERVQTIGKLRVIDYTFHDKNIYAINNNGGRNFALEHGRALPYARWVLPLDGNTFFTPPAMASLLHSFEKAEKDGSEKRHVVIPMARLLDNEALRENNTLDFDVQDPQAAAAWAPKAPDEPQVGFHYSSKEVFQPAMRYGRRSKLELLWRLGAVPRSRHLDRRTLPWEQSDREYLTGETFASIKTHQNNVYETAGYIEAGWVFRLFSGNGNQEHYTPEASSLRNMNRIRGIISHLERLDERLSRGQLCRPRDTRCGFRQSLTWMWDWNSLEALRDASKKGDQASLERILYLKGKATEIEATRAAAGHLVNLQEEADHALIFALTGFLTGDARWSDAAAGIIETRFLPESAAVQAWLHTPEHADIDGEGYIFPLVHAQDVVPPVWSELVKHHAATQHDFVQNITYNPRDLDPTPLLDATRLLGLSPRYQDRLPKMSMHALFSAHLAWLTTDPQKLHESEHPDSEQQAVAYDLQVAALAAFVDDVRLVNRVLERSQLRSPLHQLHPTLVSHLTHIRMLPPAEEYNPLQIEELPVSLRCI